MGPDILALAAGYDLLPGPVYGELKDMSGTRYAPFVVDLLADPAHREELRKDLDRWAGESYEDLFRRRQKRMK